MRDCADGGENVNSAAGDSLMLQSVSSVIARISIVTCSYLELPVGACS